MATRTSAGGACSGTLPATGHACGVTRRDRVLRALFCVLLGFCAGCTTSADQAKAMPGSSQASLRSREPVPLTAGTLLLKPVDRGRLTSGYGTRYHPSRNGGSATRVSTGQRRAAPRFVPQAMAWWSPPDGSARTATIFALTTAARLRPPTPISTAMRPNSPPVASCTRATRSAGSAGPAAPLESHLHYEILVAGRPIDPLGFAPAAAVSAQHPANAASEGAGSEFGIGGPYIAVEEEAGDAALRDDDIGALPLEAIDGSTVIRIDDLLRRHAPLKAPGRPSHSTDWPRARRLRLSLRAGSYVRSSGMGGMLAKEHKGEP